MPGGGTPVESTVVTTQWKASHGVTFAEEGPGTGLKIAKVGPSLIKAFYCGVGCALPDEDVVLPGQKVGKFFLTQREGDNPAPIRITFTNPVASFSGNILDIDGFEKWVITAYNKAGVQIGATLVLQGLNNSGAQTYFKIDHGNVADIASVVFKGTDVNSLGFALDNFSTSGTCPASQFGSK